jgi:hypothetical protein
MFVGVVSGDLATRARYAKPINDSKIFGPYQPPQRLIGSGKLALESVFLAAFLSYFCRSKIYSVGLV